MKTNAHLASEYIKQKLNYQTPKVGIVLGSGLGKLTESLSESVSIDYDELPGFPKLSVKGHSGRLTLGMLGPNAVVCLQGRSHTYESLSYEEVKTYIRTLKLLGCEYFIATNASGSLRADVGPGELMLINDHINMQPGNPLAGPNEDEFGPRFLPLDKAYDMGLQEKFLLQAKVDNIELHQGVYISVLGPSYETAAEIKAFKLLGADAVGMSTVPEVIVAHHCGLKVGVIATITNFATGLATESHDHNHVLEMANKASKQLTRLIQNTVEAL